MKKYLITLSLIPALLFSGCAMFQSAVSSDAAITSAVTVATTAGLRLIPNASERNRIANYVDVGASALRTVTGTPTPQDLSDLIVKYIPTSIKDQYPEVVAFLVPLVVSQYKSAYDKYGSNAAKVYQILNDIAVGLESGASSYASHSKTASP